MAVHDTHHHPHRGRETRQTQFIGAILLITLGAVFLAQEAGVLRHSANWWVIFLAIPGLGLIWNAYTRHQEEGEYTTGQAVALVFGAALLVLTAIFIFDPTWSFLPATFRGRFWDQAWRFVVLGVGVVLIAAGIIRRRVNTGVAGVLVTLLGLSFVFDIDLDYLWPLALIIPGVLLLVRGWNRSEQ